jgi:hypothetical protein
MARKKISLRIYRDYLPYETISGRSSRVSSPQSLSLQGKK